MGKNDEMLFKANKLRALKNRCGEGERGGISPAKWQRLKLTLVSKIKYRIELFSC